MGAQQDGWGLSQTLTIMALAAKVAASGRPQKPKRVLGCGMAMITTHDFRVDEVLPVIDEP